MPRVLRGAVAALFARRDSEILIEGRAGTGKSIGILTYLHHCARTYPGCRILICRQARKTCSESVMVSWEEKVLGPTHPLVGGGPKRINRHSHDYPNGSTVVWGGLDEPGKMFSTEWDIVYVNECTEISLAAWELFGRAMRNGKMRTPGGETFHQRIADCNPGSPGHWLNQRAHPCSDTLRRVTGMADYRRLQMYNEGPQQGPMRRMVSVHQDNPAYFELEGWRWLADGLAFVKQLESMSGNRKKRMLDGRWVADEGAVYGADFDEDVHAIVPFPVPREWPMIVGYDPGYDHPCAVLWFAVAPNGTIYIVDEVYGGGMGVQQVNETIHEHNAGRNVHRYFGDPQNIFNETQGSPKSIAQQMKEAKFPISFDGWPRTAGNEDSMVEQVRKRLQRQTLKVFKTCGNTIAEFQSWRFKRTAAGELPAGPDKYEDRGNDALDVVKGIVATDPKYDRGSIRVIGGE